MGILSGKNYFIKILLLSLFFSISFSFPIFSQCPESHFFEKFQGGGRNNFGDLLFSKNNSVFVTGTFGEDLELTSGTVFNPTDNDNTTREVFFGKWGTGNKNLEWIKSSAYCNTGSFLASSFLGERQGSVFFGFRANNCDSGEFWNGQSFGQADQIIGKMKSQDGALEKWREFYGGSFYREQFVWLNDTLAAGVFVNFDSVVRDSNGVIWKVPEEGGSFFMESSYTYFLMNDELEILESHYVYGEGNNYLTGFFTKQGDVHFLHYAGGDSVDASGSLVEKAGWSEYQITEEGDFNHQATYNQDHFKVTDYMPATNGHYFLIDYFGDTLRFQDTFLTELEGSSPRPSTLYFIKLNDQFALEFAKPIFSNQHVDAKQIGNFRGNRFSILVTFQEEAEIFNDLNFETASSTQGGYVLLLMKEEKNGVTVQNYKHAKGPHNRSEYFTAGSDVYLNDQNELYVGGANRYKTVMGNDTLAPDPFGLTDAFLYKFCEGFTSGIQRNGKTLKSALSIHPNPTSGKLSIVYPQDQQPASASVYNTQGQKVHQGTLKPGSQTWSLNLSPGLYFLRAQNQNHNFTERIVFH